MSNYTFAVAKYKGCFTIYKELDIEFRDDIRFLQPFVLNTQDSFPVFSYELALIGDSYLSMHVLRLCIDSGMVKGPATILKSNIVSNENIARFFKERIPSYRRYVHVQADSPNDHQIATVFEAMIGLYLRLNMIPVCFKLCDMLVDYSQKKYHNPIKHICRDMFEYINESTFKVDLNLKDGKLSDRPCDLSKKHASYIKSPEGPTKEATENLRKMEAYSANRFVEQKTIVPQKSEMISYSGNNNKTYTGLLPRRFIDDGWNEEDIRSLIYQNVVPLSSIPELDTRDFSVLTDDNAFHINEGDWSVGLEDYDLTEEVPEKSTKIKPSISTTEVSGSARKCRFTKGLL
jgi:hypothetical protein